VQANVRPAFGLLDPNVTFSPRYPRLQRAFKSVIFPAGKDHRRIIDSVLTDLARINVTVHYTWAGCVL